MNKKTIYLNGGLLLIFTLGALFFYYGWVHPLKNDLDTLRYQLNEERTLNQKIQETTGNDEQVQTTKTIPVDDPLVEEIILDLHTFERRTNTLVSKLSFQQGGNDTKINYGDLPIEIIMVNMNVTANNNQSLTQFLREIEMADRIYSIESVQFANINGDEPISASLVVASFYLSVEDGNE